MGSEWGVMPLKEAFHINPSVSLERGKEYEHVSMQAIDTTVRQVKSDSKRIYQGGGSRFLHGDTLFARITPCLENGKIAQFFSSLPAKGGFGSTEFIVLRGKEGTTERDFTYYFALSPAFREYAIGQMTGTSGRQRVPIDSLLDYEVDLPSIIEQRAIAHILGTLDDKIELNRRMNETLEGIARAIFKSWFVDFDPVHAKAEGRDTGLPAHIADLFPSRFVDSDLGPIPEGWEVKSLDEIANYQNGLALQKYPAKEGEAFLFRLKIRELRQGHFDDRSEKSSTSIKESCIVYDGDVVFSWSGSLLIDIWAGGTGALNQHLFKITSGEYPKWFYYFWTKHHLEAFQRIAADKATTMGHIKRRHLSEAKAVVPSAGLISGLDEILGSYLKIILNLRIQSRSLSELRDTLLPKLISGELRLEDAERFLGEVM